MKYGVLFLFLLFVLTDLRAQENFNLEKDLSKEWLKYNPGSYALVNDELLESQNTIYFKIEANQFAEGYLLVESGKTFFLFINGKLLGEYQGKTYWRLDSLRETYSTPSFFIAAHQPSINTRDLKTAIVSKQLHSSFATEGITKPPHYFKDFVIASGLLIIVLFLLIMRVNPKLGSDYFSVIRIFSLREADDAQSNARLTSSTNVQFYTSCSLLLGFYMMMILYHLPEAYALPTYFRTDSFGSAVSQWLRLSTIILGVFFIKILLIFSLTRLFGMRGMARIHFFNWVRVLLVIFGGSSIIVFIYFISRGQQAEFFVAFLSLAVITLIAWVLVAFLKLKGKSEHSLFHLFSYICATEIIPLLITVKILFQ